jgi:hypothetical protein
MKLILSKIEEFPDQTNGNELLSIKSIMYKHYNACYHFYDISMFPNRQGNDKTKYWQQLTSLFEKDGYKVYDLGPGSTFKWLQTIEKKVCIDGRRVWIYAKETKQ